jgi:hypothetical protein
MTLSRKTKNHHQLAATWQRLADIRVSIPGLGAVSVEEMLQQISASDADPTTRAQLLRELGNLATLLESLPPAARDEIIERITDTVRETYDGAST